MAEMPHEALLPPIGRQVIKIPNDIQQLTIKDATIFIGKEHPHRSMSSSCRCLRVLGLLLAFGMGAMLIKPLFPQFTTIVVVSQTGNSRNGPLPDRSITESSTKTTTTTPMTNNEPNVTILYSTMNPAADLSTYYKITSVYIARAYQTTLSFFMQNGPGYTFLDDVSVTDSYGRELLINGNFESNRSSYGYGGAYGWLGAFINTGGNAHTGQGCHGEGTSAGRNVSQAFYTTSGNVLNISFWIKWSGRGPGISTKVIVYP